MKRIKQMGIALLLMQCFVNIAMADMGHHHEPAPAVTVSVFAAKADTPKPLVKDKPTAVNLFLFNRFNGEGIGEDQLLTVHTEKMHVLIIDPTLTDYQHLHPKPGKKPGEYTVEFTPHTSNAYRIWLDITPQDRVQQYVITDLPGANKQNPPVVKTLSMNSVVEDYHFKLSFNKPLKVGESALGTVMITDKNGKDVTQLEPIMEAFAHIVAFDEDYKTILHIHPMGPEPKDLSARGGPRIDFHMTPSASGFVKIFVQVKIQGKELFAPFGVDVR